MSGCTFDELRKVMGKFPSSIIGMSRIQYDRLSKEDKRRARVVVTLRTLQKLPQLDDDAYTGQAYVEDMLNVTVALATQDLLPTPGVLQEYYNRMFGNMYHNFFDSDLRHAQFGGPITQIIMRFFNHNHLPNEHLVQFTNVYLELVETIEGAGAAAGANAKELPNSTTFCDKYMERFAALDPSEAVNLFANAWELLNGYESYPESFLEALTQKLPTWALRGSGADEKAVHDLVYAIFVECQTDTLAGDFNLIRAGVLKMTEQVAINPNVPRKLRKVYPSHLDYPLTRLPHLCTLIPPRIASRLASYSPTLTCNLPSTSNRPDNPHTNQNNGTVYPNVVHHGHFKDCCQALEGAD